MCASVKVSSRSVGQRHIRFSHTALPGSTFNLETIMATASRTSDLVKVRSAHMLIPLPFGRKDRLLPAREKLEML